MPSGYVVLFFLLSLLSLNRHFVFIHACRNISCTEQQVRFATTLLELKKIRWYSDGENVFAHDETRRSRYVERSTDLSISIRPRENDTVIISSQLPSRRKAKEVELLIVFHAAPMPPTAFITRSSQRDGGRRILDVVHWSSQDGRGPRDTVVVVESMIALPVCFSKLCSALSSAFPTSLRPNHTLHRHTTEKAHPMASTVPAIIHVTYRLSGCSPTRSLRSA